jgi:hypothetical protein
LKSPFFCDVVLRHWAMGAQFFEIAFSLNVGHQSSNHAVPRPRKQGTLTTPPRKLNNLMINVLLSALVLDVTSMNHMLLTCASLLHHRSRFSLCSVFRDIFSFYTKRAQTFLGKGPQKLLWVGLRAALKIIINGICKGTAMPI